MAMGEVQRWKVTFTKHLKQKRKVYQDGFLDIHRSSNKALLYDECEKLLECRLLKLDEGICSGETLIFNAYLVDVDIPQEDHKPDSGLNFQASEDKISEKSDLLQGKHFRKNSVFFEKNKTRPPLSPSHKIIREFKKSRLKCYGSPQNSPDTRKTVETEWQVLYTTNVTQKAKKYHDGFLKLSVCGSLGRQIMLFDESRKLLDSRFIKKDEIVKSGESIAFDAHLVEIGERERGHNPIDFSQGSNSDDGGMRGLHGQKKYFNENEKSTRKEWHVLYTNQITQKSKKYHNGIVRLSSGSHQMQVTLLNEDKIILSSKHVSLSEDFKMGYILELPKYLVEVGEACESVQGKLGDNNYNSRKDASFCISGDNEKKSGRETMKKPLRDAREILSNLQRPKARVSLSGGDTDESIGILASSNKDPELSNAVVSDLPNDDLSHQKPSKNLDMRGSTENAETNQSHVLNQPTFTSSGRTLTKDVGIGYSSQLLQSENVEDESKSFLRNLTSRIQGSSDCAACGLVNDEGKSCEESTYERKIVECPSFDLGI